MLYALAFVLLVLWALGFVSAYPLVGGFIHVLFIIAVIVVLIRLINGRRPLDG